MIAFCRSLISLFSLSSTAPFVAIVLISTGFLQPAGALPAAAAGALKRPKPKVIVKASVTTGTTSVPSSAAPSKKKPNRVTDKKPTEKPAAKPMAKPAAKPAKSPDKIVKVPAPEASAKAAPKEPIKESAQKPKNPLNKNQTLAKITSDRDSNVSRLVAILDDNAVVQGIRFDTKVYTTTPVSFTTKSYNIEEISSARGVVLLNASGYDAVFLKATVDSKEGKGKI